jgi:RNA polymerase sigma factor (sigma-70 family)
MSRLDYKFKEIPFAPAVMDSLFAAPAGNDGDGEELRKQEGEDYIRGKMRKVRRAMNRELTPRQRECLTLHYLRGYRQGEIARRLSLHQTTVSQHIQYGLKKLRRVCCL